MDDPAKPSRLHPAGAARVNRVRPDGARFTDQKDGSSIRRPGTQIEVAFTFSQL
jgi:hypothetical protein